MKGLKTRSAILERAADLASAEGLEGLTIGRLADELKMSKSGLFAHFGSKEELQLATIEIARQRFLLEVFKPGLDAERGYPRLVAICRSWLDYIARNVFSGGRFFAAASFEFDSRSGPVRDVIQKTMDEWVGAIEKAVRLAIDEGHFSRDVDAAQVAFEINAIFFGANYSYNMRHDKKAITRAWHAIETRLEGLRQAPRPARFAPPEKRPLRRRAS
ncbi:MAG TPA: TetR/AcrR family transcriptional regulator [Thermoanaerobaculia bacterium]